MQCNVYKIFQQKISFTQTVELILYYKVVPELSDLLLSLVMGIVFIVIGELLFTKLQKGFAEEF